MNGIVQQLLETDILPDWLIRIGIVNFLTGKLDENRHKSTEQQQEALLNLVREIKKGPIVSATKSIDEQRYDPPVEFFKQVLGPHMKYNCALWNEAQNLHQAESAMLKLTCERADLYDGQRILELGSGWGPLSLWLAKEFPQAHILSICDSLTKKKFIEMQCNEHRLTNLEVETANLNNFDTDHKFDRIVSVETFKHVKNYDLLLEKISRWLLPDGKFFVHSYSHIQFAFPLDRTNHWDWLAEHFFAGDFIPSDSLLLYFQQDLKIEKHWRLNGIHYRKTADAWLENMDNNRKSILPVLKRFYGKEESEKWWTNWRLFFMTCSALWGYAAGREWIISHYRFSKR